VLKTHRGCQTSQNKRRDVALTGREIITCDFCDKRGHEAGRCWKNLDNPHNRLDSSSDPGPSRINKHNKNAAKVAKESKSAARASKAYKTRKRPDSSSNESSSSDEDSDARQFRLNTAHAVSSALRADAAQQSRRIILDSGASTHMCSHETWFKVLRSRKRTDILLRDDSTFACNKEGTIHFSMGFRGKVIRFALENVLFTPGLKHTVFSCSALASAGSETLFTADLCTLIDSKYSKRTGNNRSHTAPKRHILFACCRSHQTATCSSFNLFQLSKRRRRHQCQHRTSCTVGAQ
jgi:hypothetical protein